jgi:predicted nuclease of predicted toxin-antitoxin system
VIIWVDGQLSPALAPWLTEEFHVEAFSVRYLDLRHARDRVIFDAARQANATVMTKDVDFVLLQQRFGSPPTIMWVRCGNTSNTHLKSVLRRTFESARRMIEAGVPLVEIVDPP